MVQKNRTKEVWLVPKRGSLHQTICLIDGIVNRKYDGQSWNPQKQNNLGVNLKNWGATKNGKNVSAQSIRTLTAAVPQYLGFLYINTNTTPNSICLTEAGKSLLSQHKKDLVKVKNLVEGESKLIKQSVVVLNQMEKLQLTNPICLKDCENILVFPFRMTLKLLMKLGYLDREEIAYFLLRIRDESEFDLTVKEIQNFRALKSTERTDIITIFKNTHIGNITLVQAPSASYYECLCQSTGIIEKFSMKPKNSERTLKAIKIKDDAETYVKNIIENKYCGVETYDFQNNLELWIDYIGTPQRLCPPIDVKIENELPQDILLKIKKDDKIINVDMIYNDSSIDYPMFINEEYELSIIDTEKGTEMITGKFIPTKDSTTYAISSNIKGKAKNKTISEIAENILEHSACSSFCGEILNYLTILKKTIDIDKTDDKSLRGAYYEYLFYQLLCKLKDTGAIDDVVWNGRIGKYGLPIQSPGGKTGTADMFFIIDEKHYVLELTTIKSKSAQEKAELASVPDHIRLYKDDNGSEVTGIFCAPMIHERNTEVMRTIMRQYGMKLYCIKDKDLIEIFLTEDKKKILDFFSDQKS